MPDEPMGPRPLGTAMREVTFPDQSRGIILVQAGTPQDEADAMAARVWAGLPEDREPPTPPHRQRR
ncbi:hypothetical protein SAM23877_7281 [Streptomyces ambofaciens ATCC 23877]|uniref:Uncharacterized protein n=1 Tax=Streptomyces ambofaciens (strain ATCC 23877 / 3486 / DSM 40053 / JCM 4204 / NBRC 12836 / NRRL B-2516) TaxID=278992 RepID=A0A0K2B4W9_STRA7|nr:hypothetical protein SAM23877_7281 [Streptomyces ambofaciens ATCC 23877]